MATKDELMDLMKQEQVFICFVPFGESGVGSAPSC